MKNIKASLISLDDGFKVVREIDFDSYDYPCNKKMLQGKAHEISSHFIKKWKFTYHWILSHFFTEHIIIDCQSNCELEKGHPDFIVVPKNITKLSEIIYVEFKSEPDALSPNQLKWFSENTDKKRYILKLQETPMGSI